MRKNIPEYLDKIPDDIEFNFNHKDELDYWLKEFNIQKDEICLIGSIPLHLASIRENEDVDFITTIDVEKRILSKISKYSQCKVVNKVIYFGDNIHSDALYSDRFDYFGLTNENIIYDEKYHMIVDGYKIFRLELLFSKKITEARIKDLKDVEKIEESDLIGGPGWDWQLVYSLPSWAKPQKNRTFRSRVRWKLERYGIKSSIKMILYSRFSKLHIDTTFENFLATSDKFLHLKRIYQSKIHQSHFQIRLPIPVILSSYIKRGEFCGWDIILECALASEGLPGIDDTDFEKKFMEIGGIKKDCHCSVTTLSRNGRVLQGRSVLVDKIIKNEYWIEVKIEGTSSNLWANKGWLNQIDLTDTQIKFVENRCRDILESTGLIFYAIIWPSAYDIFEDIEEYIRSKVCVIEGKKYNISHDLSHIIHKLYEGDDRAKNWRIEKKIRGMQMQKGDIRVLKLWVPNPKFRYHVDPEGVVFSKTTRELKDACRKRFYDKINSYFFDNLIHITETYKNNFDTYQVLSKLEEEHRCTVPCNSVKQATASCT